MKKIAVLFCLLSISLTAAAVETYQGQLEAYLKNNNWYVTKSNQERIFFRIFRNENDALILKTCPIYSQTETDGSFVCGSGFAILATSKEATLNYDENEKAFVGNLPGLFSGDKINLKGNSDRRLQMRLGDKVFLPKNADGNAQYGI